MTLSEFLASCPPVGGTRPVVVNLAGSPFYSFDTVAEAEAVVKMQKKTRNGGKGQPAKCAEMKWEIHVRG